jgi:hypothetical protein
MMDAQAAEHFFLWVGAIVLRKERCAVIISDADWQCAASDFRPALRPSLHDAALAARTASAMVSCPAQIPRRPIGVKMQVHRTDESAW